MTDDFERDPLARDLRDSLARHAAEAPRGEALAERIIHTSGRPTDLRERQPRSWRTWSLPLAAVGAVAAIVGAVVGIQNYHPNATGPAGTGGPSRVQTPLPTPTPAPTTTTSPSPTATNAGDLTGVRILDLTFAEGEGWALASADCTRGPGRCAALLRTSDGKSWQSMGPTPFNVFGVNNCAEPCVEHIRFANATTGYLFGPTAFLMTTDGGRSWQQQDGGALALETLDNNVIRVTSPHTGCPSWCDVGVETSDIGSTTWTPAPLAAGSVNAGGDVQLSRGGHNAYVLVIGHVSGGAETATSALYRSTDDGRTWHASNDPCLPASQPVAAIAVAAGGGDRLSALCEVRTGPTANSSARFLSTSVDAGAHFTSQPDLPDTAALVTGDPDTVLVAAGDGMSRSTDGGKTWQPVPDVTGQVTWVGFESQTDGRAVTDNRIIWTTTDGGRSWTAAHFR